jgi:predicted nucleotidyltransferase
MDREAIERIVRDVVTVSPRPIAAAWLFGSVARGEARPDSDVDVALLLAREPAGTLDEVPGELEAEIEKRVGRRAQVVVLNRAPTELAMNALSDGRLLLERDAEKRVAFEVRTMKEYWDLVPLLEIYRRGGIERR